MTATFKPAFQIDRMLYQNRMSFVGFSVLDDGVLMRPKNFTISGLINRNCLPENTIISMEFEILAHQQNSRILVTGKAANMRRFNGNNNNP